MVTQQLQRTETARAAMDDEDTEGSIVVRPGAVAKVAGMTVREMEGVSLGAMRGFATRLAGTGRGAGPEIRRAVRAGVTVDAEAVIDVAIVVDYGRNIPETVSEVRRQIHQNVLRVTGLSTRRINIEVSDISLPDETRTAGDQAD
jgi:uncharacterized alkaline shock family protein YloU